VIEHVPSVVQPKMINVKQFNRQVSDVITSYYKEPTGILNYSQMDFNDEMMT
jgi:hypothetical protein